MNTSNDFGFLALALRQRVIQRWSLMYSRFPESVLEHSAVVTLLTMMAGNLAIQNGHNVNLALMLSHAVIHDAAEVLCSDVVTPVKNASPLIAAEFKKLEAAAEERLINTLPSELKGVIEEAFSLGGYERELVKACDVYAAYIKCKLEVSAGNAVEFQDALDQTAQIVERLKNTYPEIAYIDQWFGAGIGMSVDKLLQGA